MNKKSDYPFPYLGERLKVLRTTGTLPEFEKPKNRCRKCTRDALAEILQVSTQTISSYESGKRHPSLKVLLKYSMFFNVSIDALCSPSTSEVEDTLKTYLDHSSTELNQCVRQIALALANSNFLAP